MFNRIYKNLTQAICLKKICAQNINSSIFLYIYNKYCCKIIQDFIDFEIKFYHTKISL